MTKLILHPKEGIYLSPDSEELGAGWTKWLAFIPHNQIRATELELSKVLGLGAIVIASIEGDDEWISDGWAKTLAAEGDSQLAYLVRAAGVKSVITGNLRCAKDAQNWLLKQRTEVRCTFSGQFLVLGKGTFLEYVADGAKLRLGNASTAPRLDGFELYGSRNAELRELNLDLKWPGGMHLSAQFDIRASLYDGSNAIGGITVLGQNFKRLKQTFLGTFVAEKIAFPLLATPDPATLMRFELILDPIEPQILLPLPAATRVSRVVLQEVQVNGKKLETIPLNFFTVTGTRLNVAAGELDNGLAFHFVPQLETFKNGIFGYSGAALIPNGSLKVASGSALLGVGHLERVGGFSSIEFNAFSPAPGLDAELRGNSNISCGRVELNLPDGHLLSGRSIVAATSFVKSVKGGASQTSRVFFSPDSMPLYLRRQGVGSHPYMPLDCHVPSAMPIGMVDLEHSSGKPQGAAAFERSVIALHRMRMLGSAQLRDIELAYERPQTLVTATNNVVASTPQGFKVLQDGYGLWREIEFAAGIGWKLALDLGTDLTIRKAIQDLFSRKEIFIVLEDMPMPSSGSGPSLRLEYSASGWSFSTTIESSGGGRPKPSGLSREGPIGIVKFGGRSVADLINDTSAWIGTGLFIDGGAAEVEAVRQRLSRYMDTLSADLSADKDSRKPFSAPFVSKGTNGRDTGKLMDPSWNGFCVFSLGMTGNEGTVPPDDSSPFPEDLRPLLDGYRELFSALVLCADLRPATTDDVSEILGLIRYATPKTDQPTDSTDSDCSGGFNLQLLRVLLRSGGVDNFECRLGLRLTKFLGQPIAGLGSNATLLGTYDRRTDTVPPSDVYSFALEGTFQREFEKSPVKRVLLTKIGYERTQPKSGQLLLAGEIDIAMDELGANGIRFDRLGLAFSADSRQFSFSPGLIALDFDASKFSKLLKSFPFKLKSFTFGRLPFGKFASLEQLGFQSLNFGGASASGEFAYGLTFDLDLGSLGAMARKLEAFGAQLFVGWKFDGSAKAPALGFRLNGNRGGPLEISAFDVITLKAASYAFGKLDPAVSGAQDVYFLNAQKVQVKLLNMEFPDKGADQHLYFYYPPMTPGGVGFAYGRIAPGTNLELLGIGKHTTVSNLSSAKTVEEGIGYVKNALANVDDHNLPLKPGTGMIYDSGIDWFFALSATVFDLAKVDLLMADPRIYGARITLPSSKWGLSKDWFIDMLYRRLDDKTGIFSVEVPPPIPMLDFGAVQVILPTIRGEFGAPGNHLLIDLGFPEKKSLANWARTGKIVAGIFGGEGGAYFGRIAPAAFPVKFTPAYDARYEFKDGSIFTAGIAASFGLMRYFAAGPMTGHASLTGFMTAEGSIATIELKAGKLPLNPTPPSQFLSLAGAFGIKGSVEACVDFGLIKVGVGFNLTVMFSLPYKTWHAIAMEASVTVNAYARVVIARIRIPFDGKLEISVSFSFSFETKVSVQLSGADSHLGTVFASESRVLENQARHYRDRARSLLPAINSQWAWPDPSLQSLGIVTRLPFPAWFMAAKSVDEKAVEVPGRQAAVLMPFLAIGENPQYHSDQDSVASLVNALTRWMLLQISGSGRFDPTAKIDMPTLLAAQMSLHPDGQDGAPVVWKINDPDRGHTYEQSISGEASMTALRPAFEKMNFDQLVRLYRTCLDAQVLVPASKAGLSRDEKDVPVVPYPLPPVFELFVTAHAALNDHDWTFPTTKGVDLSGHCPLTEKAVEDLRDALNDYYATLLADGKSVQVNAGVPRSMQSWLFLYWHQILCVELVRVLVASCEKRIKADPSVKTFTAGELLNEILQGGTASPGWAAVGTAARVYASGMRFKIPDSGAVLEGGMFELAGLATREPKHDEGDDVFIGLRTLISAHDWFSIDKARAKEDTHEGVKKRAIALEVSEAFAAAPFPGIRFQGCVDDKGYTLAPRQYPITQSLTLGASLQIGLFPPMLIARHRENGPGNMKWTSGGSQPLVESSDTRSFLPHSVTCVVQLQLHGRIIGGEGDAGIISLSPLLASERETLAGLMGEKLVGAKLGLRRADDSKKRPGYFEDASSVLPTLKIFRTNVTREENPPKTSLMLSTPAEAYYGQGAEDVRNVLRAWTLTAASACFLNADFSRVLPAFAVGLEVDLLLLFFPVKQSSDFVVRAANAVTYDASLPEKLLVGSRTNDLEKIPDSNRDAILIKATKKPADEAQIEIPGGLRDAIGVESVMTLRELKRRVRAGGQVKHSAASLAQSDFALLAASVEPWANHFDLLAYSVFVNGVKVVDENDVIPLLPNNVDDNGLFVAQDHTSQYVGHVPTRRLNRGGNPYALVGSSIKIYGHLRDHFGQRAPMEPVLLLDRVEEYRDEISSFDGWDHLKVSLIAQKGAPQLVVSAALKACHADSARGDLLRRRFALLKGQLEDVNLHIEVAWSFGVAALVEVPKASIVMLIDRLITSLDSDPGSSEASFKQPLAWPALPFSWCALPFGVELKIVRRVRGDIVQTASTQLSPLGQEGDQVPKGFFAPMLKQFKHALLASGDPGRGFGRYWLIHKSAVNLKVDKASAGFFAMPPFANCLVSTGTLVDRDVDLALRESFDKLDAALQVQALPRLGAGVPALLKLKKTASQKCAERTITLLKQAVATPAPSTVKRALEDAVAAKAGDAYRISSVLNLKVDAPDVEAVANIMKITGELVPNGSSTTGQEQEGLGVTTIGIVRDGGELQIPLVIWDRAIESGSVSVPALTFKPLQVQIDVKSFSANTATTVVDPVSDPSAVGHWLNLHDVDGMGPELLQLEAFEAPSPRRKAVATPLAKAQKSAPSIDAPASLAEAKNWTYTATFELPASATFDPGVDFLHGEIEYPSYDGYRLIAEHDPVPALLAAAFTFNRVAAQSVAATPGQLSLADTHDLTLAAAELETALSVFPFHVVATAELDHVDRISLVPMSTKWKLELDPQNMCKLIVGEVKNGNQFKVEARELDVCAFPSASASLQVSRNEKLRFGYGKAVALQVLDERFVYRTPRVGFSDAVMANLTLASPLRAGQAGAQVADWVQSVYDELLMRLLAVPDNNSRSSLSIQCRVGWSVANINRLVGDDVEPAPVTLVFVIAADAANVRAMVKEQVNRWLKEIDMVGLPTSGYWSLDVAVFKQATQPSGAKVSRGVANLRRLKPIS